MVCRVSPEALESARRPAVIARYVYICSVAENQTVPESRVARVAWSKVDDEY